MSAPELQKSNKLLSYVPSGLKKTYGAEVLQDLGIIARVLPVVEAEAREVLNAAKMRRPLLTQICHKRART